MLLALVTPPAQEPVTLAEAKAHLRLLHADEDTVVSNAIRAARIHAEATTGRALITQTWDFWLPAFPRSGLIELPRPPLQSVTHVTYRDLDGAEQTVDAADYIVVAPGIVGTVREAPEFDWPATGRHPQAVNVRFVAGYGDDAAELAAQEDLRAALLMLIEHLYHNRGAATEANLKATPMGVASLLAPHLTHGWGPPQVTNEIDEAVR